MKKLIATLKRISKKMEYDDLNFIMDAAAQLYRKMVYGNWK